MINVALIDRPFALKECPAFGLTQIKDDLTLHLAGSVHCDLLYLNHAFYQIAGEDIFRFVNGDFYGYYRFEDNYHYMIEEHQKSGLDVEYNGAELGNWIFSKAAFPEKKDDTEDYLQQYFPHSPDLQTAVRRLRNQVDDHLDSLYRTYNLNRYDVVAFTSKFHQQTAAMAMARLCRQHNPSVITAMGGPGCEPPYGAELAKQKSSIQFFFSGRRFLIGFRRFISFIQQGRLDRVQTIPGVYTYEKYRKSLTCGKPYNPLEESEEEPIDTVSPPDYTSYFESLDQHFKDCVVEPVLFFETSRGCYWGVRHRCNFCAYDGYRKHFSPMHPSVMIAYLNTMFARYSDRCKYFIAVDSCLAPRYLDTVFPYVTIPSHVSILYDVRVTLTRDQLRRLASYRIHLLLAGIESFSSDALALLNKGTTAFDNIAFMKNCRRYGLEISWNILVNIPGETIDMLKQTWRTMQALTHLYPPKGVWLVSFQGNCRYADNPSQFQIQLSPLTESLSYVYPFLEKALQALTYFKTRIDEKDSLHNRQHLVMINRMIASAEIWKSAWRVDKKNLPNLYRDEDTIYDNRTSIQSYTLMEKQIDILDYLEQPHSLEEISKYMGISVETALGQIKYLCDKQLLFEENNCYISLVL